MHELSARYGHSEVLRQVSFTLYPETCLSIVGESGSGKTTLARCVVGMHAKWSGEVRFGGQAVAAAAQGRPRETLRRIQYIFQNPYTSLNPRKTVGQLVSQPLEHFCHVPRSVVNARVASVLEDVSPRPALCLAGPTNSPGANASELQLREP